MEGGANEVLQKRRLQASRFEFKYLISERRARAIQNFIRGYLVPDDNLRPDQPDGYPVHSLYMDTPDLKLYNQTIQGHKNRFKLRIRFYDDNPRTPAFLEIKRRETLVIKKERAAIKKEGVARLLKGEFLSTSYLLKGNDDSKGAVALHNFCSLCDEIGARAALYVSYFREAYVSPNSDQIRVTFDRHIVARKYNSQTVLGVADKGCPTDVNQVVLELKFTDRFPVWMHDLVRHYNLQRLSVPKYIECVDAMKLRPNTFLGT